MKSGKRLLALLAALTLIATEALTPGIVLAESSTAEIVLEESVPGETEAVPAESIPAETEAVPAESVPGEAEAVPAESIPTETEAVPAESDPAETEAVPAESVPAEPASEESESIASEEESAAESIDDSGESFEEAAEDESAAESSDESLPEESAETESGPEIEGVVGGSGEKEIDILESEEMPQEAGAGHEVNNIHNGSSVVTAHLYAKNGGYMTVDGVSDSDGNARLLVQEYDSNFKWLSRRYIEGELPIYGGFYAAGNAYYYLSGQNNYDEDNNIEVFRITKYDTSWKRLGSVSLKGANTYIPFDSGSARFASYGNYLFIRTSHEMYHDSEGIHHQANVTMKINTSTMKIESSNTGVGHITLGYVSHSFNQFIVVDDAGYVVGLDHGDAHPRGAILGRYKTTAESVSVGGYNSYEAISTLNYYGDKNDSMGSTLGGLSFSNSNYLTAGSSTRQDGSDDTVRNVYVSVNPRSGFPGATQIKWLSSYEAQGTFTAGNPHLVKINDNKFLVLWEEASGEGSYSRKWNGCCHYAFIDGSGNLIKAGEFEGGLSRCVPIVQGDTVCWYVTNADQTTFYVLDMDGNLSVFNYTVTIKSAQNERSGVLLTWDGEGNSNNYNIYRRENSVYAKWELIGLVQGSSYLDKTALSGEDYYYTIRPATSDGTDIPCGWDATGIYIFRLTVPELTLVEADEKGLKLTWTSEKGKNDPDYHPDQFIIWRKTEGGKWEPAGTAEFEDSFYIREWRYTDTTAKPGVLYYYTVSARHTRMGQTFESLKDETGLPGMYLPQPTVKKLSAEASGVRVSWNASEGAKSYKVYRIIRWQLEEIKEYLSQGMWISYEWTLLGTTSNTSFLDNKVGTGDWYYAVQAVKESYESTRDAELTAPHIVFVPRTSIVTASYKAADEQVYLYWNYLSGASGYYVYRRVGSGEWTRIGETASGTRSLYDKAPLLGKTAEYAVAAFYKDADGKIHEALKSDPAMVDLNKIRLYQVSAENAVYTGSALTPAFKVVNKSDGRVLSTSYYTAKYSNNVKAGKGKITVTGKGEYTGTITGTFVIEPKALETSMVGAVKAQTYTGAALTPAVTVTDGSTALAAGTDYTVTYTNNTNAGTATIKVTGKGNYKGTVTVTFAINKAAPSLKFAKSSLTKTNLDAAFTNELTATTDGAVTYASSDTKVAAVNKTSGKVTIKGIGTATITATAAAGTNYKAGSAKYTLTVKDGRTDLSGFAVTLSATKYTYDGKAKEPAVTVKDGSTALTAGTDYTVTYADNVNAGTATATVTGAGKYKGTARASFTISKAAPSLKFAKSSLTKTSLDAAFTNKLTATTDGAVTIASSDTKVAAVNKTSGKVTIKGIGTATITATAAAGTNYKAGSAKYTLTVKDGRIDVADLTITLSKTKYTYDGKAKKPAVTVKNRSETLTAGTDYTVSYGKNINPPSGTVTVAGMGSYKGSVTKTFTIDGGPIRSISLSETDITLIYGNEKALPEVTYKPDFTTDEKTVTWSSSDTSRVAVTGGKIKAADPGKAVITAAVPGRKVSAKADVRVLFKDVTDPKAWYFDSVYWALDEHVTSGYGKGTFRPMAGLNRAQVVGFLYNLAGNPDVSKLAAVKFSDVGKDDWYYNAVRWAVANKITSGYGQGTFRPNASCTRAMIVTFIKNYAKYAGTYADPKTTSNFSDVAEDAWYKEAVDWAVANGITSGYGEGTFSPDVTCNRAMMVAFLRKAAGLPKV